MGWLGVTLLTAVQVVGRAAHPGRGPEGLQFSLEDTLDASIPQDGSSASW